MTLMNASVLLQDLTPGRPSITFSLKYNPIREVVGNLQRGKQVEINGICGTVYGVEIDPERDTVIVDLLVREGIC